MAMGSREYPRSFHCKSVYWDAAKARAESEGEQLTGLIREFVEDYAKGKPLERAYVRLSAAEHEAVCDALCGLDIAGIVVDTINKERG